MKHIDISHFTTESGFDTEHVRLTYEVFGPPLGTAPIVLVNHALTGNSHCAGEDGWWSNLISSSGGIDLDRYTIICFNIPGNGYDLLVSEVSEHLVLRDVARLFALGLEAVGIKHLYAIIGASLGGAIGLQIAHLNPELADHIFCIASDYRAGDWLLAQTLIQQRILDHSNAPLEDARMHAMLCYRTPESLARRFDTGKTRDPNKYDIVSWLEYHGDTLARRFRLSAYRLMTRLTESIHVCDTAEELASLRGAVHWVSIDSDLLFPHHRALETCARLQALRPDCTLDTLHSIHGHDAFLMDYPQLNQIIKPYFI